MPFFREVVFLYLLHLSVVAVLVYFLPALSNTKIIILNSYIISVIILIYSLHQHIFFILSSSSVSVGTFYGPFMMSNCHLSSFYYPEQSRLKSPSSSLCQCATQAWSAVKYVKYHIKKTYKLSHNTVLCKRGNSVCWWTSFDFGQFKHYICTAINDKCWTNSWPQMDYVRACSVINVCAFAYAALWNH